MEVGKFYNREPSAHKIVILGDSQVGKTSIINKQLQDGNIEVPAPTVGCHCSELLLNVDGDRVILQIWDTAGQEIYRSLVPVYLRGAQAALLVYDVTDSHSFENLTGWYDTLLQVVPACVATFVVANKIDLQGCVVVGDDAANRFVSEHRFHFFKVSAVTGEGLQELFDAIARTVAASSKVKNEARRQVTLEDKAPEPICVC
jgi:small GTP-binding protein